MLSQAITEELEKIVGNGNVQTSQASRLVYSYDATPNFQALPDAVVAPRSTEEVAEVVKVCNREKIPIVPRGQVRIYAQGLCRQKAALFCCSNI